MARDGAVLGALAMTLLTGCVTSRPVSTVPPPAALPAAAAEPAQRTLSYPHGQWILRGEGTMRSPYAWVLRGEGTIRSPYAWVWMPTGATPPPTR